MRPDPESAPMIPDAVRGNASDLAALNSIARIATADLELRPMLQRIVDALHHYFGWEFIACATIDSHGRRFVCQALYSELQTEVYVGYSRDLGSGVVGEVALSGTTIEIDDPATQQNFVDTLHGTRAELCVPVKHNGRVLAVLNVESRTPGALRGQRVMLETVAEQIAGAIHMASAARRLAEVNQLLEQRSSELEAANAQLCDANLALHRLSQRDGLTGVANRRRFDAQLEKLWGEAVANDDVLGLLLIDLDHFKGYNDGFGHLAGDDCLRRTASVMDIALNAHGAELARYGGEEFAALLAGLDGEQAGAIAEQLRSAVADLNIPHLHGSRVTVSIGVATCTPATSGTAERLVQRADTALYEAKRRQRNCLVLAP